MSNSLQHQGLQHARLLCPLLSLEVCSNPCPLSQRCHTTISSSVASFSSCPQSFPASGSCESALHIRWPKYWSFSFSNRSSNEYSGLISFNVDWFGLCVPASRMFISLLHYETHVSAKAHSQTQFLKNFPLW